MNSILIDVDTRTYSVWRSVDKFYIQRNIFGKEESISFDN